MSKRSDETLQSLVNIFLRKNGGLRFPLGQLRVDLKEVGSTY